MTNPKPDNDVLSAIDTIRREIGRMSRTNLESLVETTLNTVAMYSEALAAQKQRIDELEAKDKQP